MAGSFSFPGCQVECACAHAGYLVIGAGRLRLGIVVYNPCIGCPDGGSILGRSAFLTGLSHFVVANQCLFRGAETGPEFSGG